ncbi:MAG: ABC transporter ATP-binding protein, partial [Clostridia bacterium]|nr:ABC transporter ATP-binding protein [Clostridia bacterium]
MNWQVLKKVLRYIGQYKWPTFLSFLLSAVTVVLTLYVPVLAGNAIDQILDTGVNFTAILPILMRIVICVAITAVIQWVMNVINNRVTFHVVRDLREDALRKISQLPLSYIDAHPHGEIVSRVIADADQFADGLLMGFTQLFTGVLTIAGTLIIMLIRNWAIALVVVMITPLSLFVARFIARRTYDMFRLQSETRGEMTAYIDEMIGNAKVVKAFGREKQCLSEFDEVNDRLEGCSLRAIFFSSITNPSTRFVNSVVYACVALSGALVALHGGMTVGALTCFLSYANQYTKPFNEISGVVTELQNAIACAARLLQLIAEAPQTPEKPDARVLTDVQGSVACENVSFSYDRKKELIRNFNLSVKPGQRIAIVGPTGCGKTTIINLLMRFYDVNGG